MTTTTKTRRRDTVAKAKPEAIVNDQPRTFDDFPVGTVAHQGDVIFVAIASLPMSAGPRANRQLADGNTQGSRHMLVGGECYDCDRNELAAELNRLYRGAGVAEQYIGPVLRGPCEIQHPEHGDHIHTTDAVIAVVYQRNLDAEQREQRTLD